MKSDPVLRMHLIPLILIAVTLLFYGIEGGVDQLNAKTKKSCPSVKCPGGKPKQCAYGYQKKDGCEICRCDDPCNSPGKAILCGSKQRCFIDQKGNGTFVARCDNAPQKTKPNKNNKKNKKAPPLRSADIPHNATWTQNGVTVAGGNGDGTESNQLSRPLGLFVNDDQTVYITDHGNLRIVKWKRGATIGQVIAGGNGKGNRTDQLNYPTDVIVDKERDSLIICDSSNKRVVRWPCRDSTNGETIISNINCQGLTMDDNGFLYICDTEKYEVRRWRVGETSGTVVAGGNGIGDRLDQLNGPYNVFVDQDYSVYASDEWNHRVIKWTKGAKKGIVVAGGRGKGNALTQLNAPQGVVVDQSGTVYVADWSNHRIMRWLKGAIHGSVLAGGNGKKGQPNQLNYPWGLSFDRHGNIYVAEQFNHRVQRFNIARSSLS